MRRKVSVGLALALVAAVGLLVWRGSRTPTLEKSEQDTEVTIAQPKAALSPSVIAVPAPSAAPPATSAVELPWGSREGELGRQRREEGNAEGPMAIAAAPDGTAVIVDQVNGRLVRIGPDGKPRGSVGLPVSAAQDVALAEDGKVAVLDRLVDKTVAVMGADGKVIGRLPLEGKGVEESGGVTGVFTSGKKVYAEVEHGALVLLGDTDGKPADERTELPGRPSRDGKTVWQAGITDGPAGRVWLTATDLSTTQSRFTRELRMNATVNAILLLDTDKQGVVYLATAALAGDEMVLLTCVAPADGHVLGVVQLPANTMPEESLRDFAVLDEGGVLYQHRTDQGVKLGKYDCR